MRSSPLLALSQAS